MTCYTSYSQLHGNILKFGDEVHFSTTEKYNVSKTHLSHRTSCLNEMIFSELKIWDKHSFCAKHYGYESLGGVFPECRPGDFGALTRVALALFDYKRGIDEGFTDRNGVITSKGKENRWETFNADRMASYTFAMAVSTESTPEIVIRSSRDLEKRGCIKTGDVIYFPGLASKYVVKEGVAVNVDKKAPVNVSTIGDNAEVWRFIGADTISSRAQLLSRWTIYGFTFESEYSFGYAEFSTPDMQRGTGRYHQNCLYPVLLEMLRACEAKVSSSTTTSQESTKEKKVTIDEPAPIITPVQVEKIELLSSFPTTQELVTAINALIKAHNQK